MTTKLDNLEQLALEVERKAGALESVLLSLVGRVASWVGPVPVALFTASELDNVFSTSAVMALVAAAAMELIGVNLASRWMKFKLDGDAEERLALWLMCGFYVLDFIITAFIVVRRVVDGGSFTYVIAALFPIAAALSIVSLNQSIGVQRRQAEKAEASRLRKAERNAAQATTQETQTIADPTIATQSKKNGNGHKRNVCVYCDAEFEKPQGLSAHLRHCAAYQTHKAHMVEV